MTFSLARSLLLADAVSPEAMSQALLASATRGTSLVRALLATRAVDAMRLEQQLAPAMRHVAPVLSLVQQLPPGLCERLLALPVRRDPRTGTIDVAVVDARDPHPVEEIAFWLRAPVRMVRTSLAAMDAALRRLHDKPAEAGPRSLAAPIWVPPGQEAPRDLTKTPAYGSPVAAPYVLPVPMNAVPMNASRAPSLVPETARVPAPAASSPPRPVVPAPAPAPVAVAIPFPPPVAVAPVPPSPPEPDTLPGPRDDDDVTEVHDFGFAGPNIPLLLTRRSLPPAPPSGPTIVDERPAPAAPADAHEPVIDLRRPSKRPEPPEPVLDLRRRKSVFPSNAPPMPFPPPGPALDAIRAAADRDAILEQVVAAVRLFARKVAVLAVRKDVLIGWTCSPELADRATFRTARIATSVSAELTGALGTEKATLVRIPKDAAHAPLLAAMKVPPAGEVALATVRVDGKSVALVLADELIDSAEGTKRLEDIARVAGESLTKLLRDKHK
jgi:hypothetical protein